MKWFLSMLGGLSLIVLAVGLASAQGKVNFSGTWVLDKSKSDVSELLGTGERAEKLQDASLIMVVKQEGTTLRVTRTLKVEGEEKQRTFMYRTDGAKTTNTSPRGRSIDSKASWEGKNLVIVSTSELTILWKEFSANIKEVWSLSPDGKTLTIDAQIHSPRGDQRVKALFDKR
jgi:hypothetical protein